MSTLEELKESGGSDDLIGIIAWGFKERERIRAAKEELDKDTETINQVIMGTMNKLGIAQAQDPYYGSLTIQTGTSSNLDKGAMIRGFLNKGVSAALVSVVIEEATKVTQKKPSLTYRPNK